MKRLAAMILAIVMVLALAACGGNDVSGGSGADNPSTNSSSSTTGTDTASPSVTADATEGEAVTLTLGTATADDHGYTFAANRMSQMLAERTGGRITLQVFANSQLGSERDLTEGVTLGSVDMTIVTMDGAVPTWVPDTAVMSIPYLFADSNEVYDALDNYLYDRLEPEYEAAGMKNLGFTAIGFRHFTNNVRAIHSAADVKGLTIRVQESPVWFGLCDCLGAVASPVAFSELYTALQQGVVDGQENPIGTIVTQKYYEVQDYVALDGHTFGAGNILMNLNRFNSLSAEDQALIAEVAQAAAVEERQYIAGSEAQWLEDIKASGTEVDENPDLDSFVQATVGMELRSDIAAGFQDVGIVQEVRDYLASK